MNGINGIGAAPTAADAPTGVGEAGAGDFDALLNEGMTNMSAVMFQFLGGDILQSIMKDESAVD